ncbi:FAD-dependent oxidoreductase [Cytophagaceae bacterium YF14B1]|uniref:FAD-dependent oxidoreductase n=1 Tax=Xanthocytophaga flava TaxID=3048013 RepID=A0AAE3QUI4_9BACT|nr:FAD-dependent oxidoreductase [Xanthocytophaga flavus]MDJ1483490.1 FAD-dependent oxidoreductase [Xanthocytophaga flavus]
MGFPKKYDIIVVGGGPIGLAAAYNSAKRGKSVLLLERFNFFNQSGSSNDLVRMFRTMYTQYFMAVLAKESIQVWKDFESDAAEQMILMTGLLNFGNPSYDMGPEGNLLDPIKNLKKLDMPYRELTAKEIMQEYPFKDLPSSYLGVFAPDNGCINVPLTLRNLYRLSQSYGAVLIPHVEVLDLKISEAEVVIKAKAQTEESEFIAEKVIIASGAYTNDILQSINLELDLQIWEMVYEYYAADPGPKGAYFPSMWFQFENNTNNDPAKSNLFYGFPSVPWGPPNLMRIAVDNAVNIITNPKERQIIPSANDLQITADYVEKHIIGVDNRPNFCGTCLQTNVVDNMYVLDFLPDNIPGHNRVAVFTAGWAFKLVPLIGKILSQLIIDGSTTYDISEFKITRPGIIKGSKKTINHDFNRLFYISHM